MSRLRKGTIIKFSNGQTASGYLMDLRTKGYVDMRPSVECLDTEYLRLSVPVFGIVLPEHLLQQGRITVPAGIQQCEPAGDAVSYASYLNHLKRL